MKFVKHYKYVFFLLILISSTSCEKKIDYQLETQIPKVVMYAFPMPDSSLNIHAGYTTNILSTDDFEPIDNLTFTININNNELTTSFYPYGKKWHRVPNYIIEPNHTCKISYEINSGSIVTGETTIPEPIKINKIDTIRTTASNNEGDKETMLRCSIELNDPINQTNFFQVRVDLLTTNSSNETSLETIEFIKEDKVFLIRDDESVLLADVDFQGTFTDYLFEGRTYRVNLLIPYNFISTTNVDEQKQLVFHLYTLTEEYYNFIRSTIEEEAFREYPVFEPVNLYSNVENGIGVVAGLSVDTDTISLN